MMNDGRIMLVEDEIITALDIRRMIERIGYEVSATFASGYEAVQRVQEINPDLIVMDIILNDEIDGIEATRIITSLLDVPVIFITALTDMTTIKRADTMKHYGYLIKPVDQNNLASIISTALQRHRIESGNKTDAQPTQQ